MKVRDVLRLLREYGWEGVSSAAFFGKRDSCNEDQMSRYLYVIEASKAGFSAYVPDLDGCVATGGTREELGRNIRGAIKLHLQGMRQDGVPVPPPSTSAGYADIAA
jgi:predicted RNase H-like HicB family nuclease